MVNTGKISFIQAASIIMLTVGLTNHVMIIPILLDEAGRDSWISVIIASLAYIPIIICIHYIIKKTGQMSIRDWLSDRFGRWATWPFLLIFIVYFVFMGAFTLKDTNTWTISSYLPGTPSFVLSLSGLLLCSVAAYSGLQAISITSGMLLPIVILLGFFVMSANFEHKDYNYLFPLFEYGWTPSLRGAFFVLSGFSEIVILLLIQHRLRRKVKLWHILLLAIILAWLTLGPTMGSIAEFGPGEAAKQRYPPFEQWRLVKVGRYIEHLDFFSIYQWLTGAFIRISITQFLILELLDVRKKLARVIVLFGLGVITFFICELPYSDPVFLSILKNYYYPYSFFMMISVILILTLLASLSRRKGAGKHEMDSKMDDSAGHAIQERSEGSYPLE